MSLESAALQNLDNTTQSIYIITAAITILIYDHALTSEQEMRLVWRAPWNLAKTVFLFIRYYSPLSTLLILFIPLQGHLSDVESCKVLVGLISVSITLCHASADLLLLIRVYAIWMRSRKVLITMSTLWVASYVTIAVADATLLANVNEQLRVDHTCFADQVSPAMYFGWASSVIFDTVAFGLTITKAMEHWKVNQIHTPLLRVFYLDGTGYYFVLTFLRIFTFMGSATGNITLFTISTHLVRALTVLFTTRMFLNLRSIRTHEDWATATDVRPARDRRGRGDWEERGHAHEKAPDETITIRFDSRSELMR